MTAWTRIDFGVNVKFHAAPAELHTALLADMAARNYVPTATFEDPDCPNGHGDAPHEEN